MTMVHVFHSRIPSCFFVLKSGVYKYFVNGILSLADDTEAAEIVAEVNKGHPHIFQKQGQETMDSAELDPLAGLRAKYFAEFQALQAAALNPDNDRGVTSQGPINPANSRDIAAAAAQGVITTVTATPTTPSQSGAKSFDLSSLLSKGK